LNSLITLKTLGPGCVVIGALACSGGEDATNVAEAASPARESPAPEAAPVDPAAPAVPGLHPLVIVTERESPEVAVNYLHVLAAWPSDGLLDYDAALELGEFVTARAIGGVLYTYDPNNFEVERLEVGADLSVRSTGRVSFMTYGIDAYSETIWVSPERAFLVDELSGQLVLWNPSRMEIVRSIPIEPSLLERDGMPAVLQQGMCVGERCFTAINWRDWSTNEYHSAAALALFDGSANEPALRVVEDGRCAPSSSLAPFGDEAGNIYVIGDGGLGFDRLASPNKTTLPQCVLRIPAGSEEFDPNFFVDLNAVTGSPGFYTAHPMANRQLLVNIWSPEVNVQEVADPVSSEWYWSNPPYFEYAIVDLEAGSSMPVPDLPRAGVQFSTTLRVDDLNYVQLYREDGGTSLYRVDIDGTVTPVLDSGRGTDVQYLGRL
jgi:hypothetical protein